MSCWLPFRTDAASAPRRWLRGLGTSHKDSSIISFSIILQRGASSAAQSAPRSTLEDIFQAGLSLVLPRMLLLMRLLCLGLLLYWARQCGPGPKSPEGHLLAGSKGCSTSRFTSSSTERSNISRRRGRSSSSSSSTTTRSRRGIRRITSSGTKRSSISSNVPESRSKVLRSVRSSSSRS